MRFEQAYYASSRENLQNTGGLGIVSSSVPQHDILCELGAIVGNTPEPGVTLRFLTYSDRLRAFVSMGSTRGPSVEGRSSPFVHILFPQQQAEALSPVQYLVPIRFETSLDAPPAVTVELAEEAAPLPDLSPGQLAWLMRRVYRTVLQGDGEAPLTFACREQDRDRYFCKVMQWVHSLLPQRLRQKAGACSGERGQNIYRFQFDAENRAGLDIAQLEQLMGDTAEHRLYLHMARLLLEEPQSFYNLTEQMDQRIEEADSMLNYKSFLLLTLCLPELSNLLAGASAEEHRAWQGLLSGLMGNGQLIWHSCAVQFLRAAPTHPVSEELRGRWDLLNDLDLSQTDRAELMQTILQALYVVDKPRCSKLWDTLCKRDSALANLVGKRNRTLHPQDGFHAGSPFDSYSDCSQLFQFFCREKSRLEEHSPGCHKLREQFSDKLLALSGNELDKVLLNAPPKLEDYIKQEPLLEWFHNARQGASTLVELTRDVPLWVKHKLLRGKWKGEIDQLLQRNPTTATEWKICCELRDHAGLSDNLLRQYWARCIGAICTPAQAEDFLLPLTAPMTILLKEVLQQRLKTLFRQDNYGDWIGTWRALQAHFGRDILPDNLWPARKPQIQRQPLPKQHTEPQRTKPYQVASQRTEPYGAVPQHVDSQKDGPPSATPETAGSEMPFWQQYTSLKTNDTLDASMWSRLHKAIPSTGLYLNPQQLSQLISQPSQPGSEAERTKTLAAVFYSSPLDNLMAYFRQISPLYLEPFRIFFQAKTGWQLKDTVAVLTHYQLILPALSAHWNHEDIWQFDTVLKCFMADPQLAKTNFCRPLDGICPGYNLVLGLASLGPMPPIEENQRAFLWSWYHQTKKPTVLSAFLPDWNKDKQAFIDQARSGLPAGHTLKESTLRKHIKGQAKRLKCRKPPKKQTITLPHKLLNLLIVIITLMNLGYYILFGFIIFNFTGAAVPLARNYYEQITQSPRDTARQNTAAIKPDMGGGNANDS